MVEKKAFKSAVAAVIKNNNSECSICVQNVDSGTLAFANLRGVKMSWGGEALMLYQPREITFKIPYSEIKEYHEFPARRQIEIVVEGRNLVSIRECV
jgi:hypothetical protein